MIEFPQMPGKMTAAARARWLAELSDALDAAQEAVSKLAGRLSIPAAMELYVRIEAARLEVRALRLRGRRMPGEEIDPERTQQLPWERNATGF